MQRKNEHQSVLMNEVLEVLNIKADGIYFDGTFGRGGHAGAILERLGPEGRLLAMDKDPDAIAFARKKFESESRFEIRQGSFAMMTEVVEELGLVQQIDGILLDLGVSSPQIDNADRGFSFMKDGPLDMRMDTSQGQSAAQWLANAELEAISNVIRDFGEERFHFRIARAIVEYRQTDTLSTTLQLANLIEKTVPKREKGKHPATRSFQAIRIYINHELDDLKAGLEQSVSVLKTGGRLAVISFHSLEDRLVKRFFREKVEGKRLPFDLPVQNEETGAELRLVGRALRPGAAEVDSNVRSRSSSLRVAEKIT